MDKRGDLRGDLFRNKKGQFFLIAALVIVVIILGLASIQVSTKVSKENVRIYDLTNEIDLEGKSVVDHGVFMGNTQTEIACMIYGVEGVNNCEVDGIFTYYVETNPNSNFAIVYGNTEGYNVIKTEDKILAQSSLVSGGSNPEIKVGSKYINVYPGEPCPSTGECPVEVEIAEGTKEFTLREGQNFFILMGEVDEATGAVTLSASDKPSF